MAAHYRTSCHLVCVVAWERNREYSLLVPEVLCGIFFLSLCVARFVQLESTGAMVPAPQLLTSGKQPLTRCWPRLFLVSEIYFA